MSNSSNNAPYKCVWLHATVYIFMYISTAAFPTFPAAEFFGVPEGEVDSISQFLCHVNPKEKKCCQCSNSFHNEQWCIDVIWDDDLNSNLTQYLKLLESFYTNHFETHNSYSCEPLFPTKYGINVPFVSMLSQYTNSDGEYVDCFDDTNTRDNIRPIFTDYGELYVNQMCADKDDLPFETYGITARVFCKRREARVIKNKLLSDKDISDQTNCFYHPSDEDVKTVVDEYHCPSEKSVCDVGNVNYKLCKAYFAPTRGYKNYHCYMCDKMNSTETSFPLDNCKYDCTNDICKSAIDSYNVYVYPFIFDLYSTHQNEYRVGDVRNHFPVSYFFQAIGAEQMLTSFVSSNELCERISPKTCCSCDIKICMKFNLCCMDVLWDKKHSTTILQYIIDFQAKTKKFKRQSCQKLIPGTQTVSNWYYMVSTCTNESSAILREKCSSLTLFIDSYLPVIGQDKYLYRNRYCAECNLVKKYNPVSIKAGCTGESTHVSALTCRFFINDNDKEIINECLDREAFDFVAYNKSCKLYEGALEPFQRIHCSSCSYDQYYNDTKKIDIKWYAIIHFHNNYTEATVFKNEGIFKVCDINNMFSAMYVKDRSDLECGNDAKTKRMDKRILFPLNCVTERYQLNLFLLVNDTIGYSDISVQALFGVTIKHSVVYPKEYDKLAVMGTNISLTGELLDHILSKQDEINDYMKKSQDEIVFMPNDNLFRSKHTTIFQSFPNDTLCHTMSNEKLSIKNFTQICMIIKKQKSLNVSLHLHIDRHGIYFNLVQCKLFFSKPNCQSRNVTKDITIKDNGELIYSEKGRKEVYSIDEYGPIRDGMGICIKQKQSVPSTWFDIVDDVRIYLAIATSSFSFISYLITMTKINNFWFLTNLFRNAAFVLVVNFFFTDGVFLFANILYATGYNSLFTLCKVTGIIQHFGLLSSFTWNTILSYGLMRKIHGKQNQNDHSILRCFLIILPPLSVIILLTIVLDNEKLISMGFGDNGTCNSQGSSGRIYFSVTPITVLIISSLVFLTKCIFIKHEFRDISDEKPEDNREMMIMNLAMMMLKITILFSITEGIGFFQISHSMERDSAFNVIIGVLYSVLRGLRGTILLIVYTCKRSHNVTKNIKRERRGNDQHTKIIHLKNEIEMKDINSSPSA